MSHAAILSHTPRTAYPRRPSPTKFTIKVKEYDIVAYYISGENHYPILSSGQLETSSVSLVSLPETYLSVLFNDSEQIKTSSESFIVNRIKSDVTLLGASSTFWIAALSSGLIWESSDVKALICSLSLKRTDK